MVFLLACALFLGDDSSDPECAREPPLDYTGFGEGFLTTHCLGCHSSLLPAEMRHDSPVGVDFDTYERVLQWADRIEARATGAEPTMPPSGGPSKDEIALLTEWLHCQVAEDVALYSGGGQ